MPTPVDPILEVRDLKTHFFTKRGVGRAVDGVSFELAAGETLGLVGESGCGKSVTCLSIVKLNPVPASRIVGGEVRLLGEDLLRKSDKELSSIRGRRIAMVLQDPGTALNPVFTIGHQLYEPLRRHRSLRGNALRNKAFDLLRTMRIPPTTARLKSYPHQFSGGMRQRAVGAIALSCDPVVLLADEPTTALDVTIQAAYLELLKDVQTETDIGIIFVTHDFGIVAQICHRVAVMYAGRIIETAPTEVLFAEPAHPYTVGLLRSVPRPGQSHRRLATIKGQPPSIYDRTSGCPFAARCPDVHEPCHEHFPPEVKLGDGHDVRCWKYVKP